MFTDLAEAFAPELTQAWDYLPACMSSGQTVDDDGHDLLFVSAVDAELDEEDDEGDWQVLILDRFHDRLICGDLLSSKEGRF